MAAEEVEHYADYGGTEHRCAFCHLHVYACFCGHKDYQHDQQRRID